ncbi:hypothetical protein NDU88_005817 [Pleurodeles waltl]|uniref:Uncharacterized protein n=1 Tax=Pleurodeles waltl TaxID=8319 RepID=A0AAV7SMR7_PLEWA|nr:hypothetical protein NDU88_005817 [Pleurodeles waltl]
MLARIRLGQEALVKLPIGASSHCAAKRRERRGELEISLNDSLASPCEVISWQRPFYLLTSRFDHRFLLPASQSLLRVSATLGLQEFSKVGGQRGLHTHAVLYPVELLVHQGFIPPKPLVRAASSAALIATAW